jgi:hypothetical protein
MVTLSCTSLPSASLYSRNVCTFGFQMRRLLRGSQAAGGV